MSKKTSGGKNRGRFFKKTAMTSALLALSSFAATGSFAHGGGGGHQTINCDIAIVGAGPGGLHTAYKLTNGILPTLAQRQGVCVFEKKDHVGGRVNDVNLGTGVTGAGPYRMYMSHYTYNLYDELFPTSTPDRLPEYPLDTLNVIDTPLGGRKVAYNTNRNNVLAPFYKNITVPDFENSIWDALLCGLDAANPVPLDPPGVTGFSKPRYDLVPNVKNMSAYDYLKYTLSKNHLKYMRDIYRFRGDFVLNADAVSYMRYNSGDFAGFGDYGNIYPIPGHSVLMNAMRDKILAGAGRIYLNQTVEEISRSHGAFPYRLETTSYNVNAKKVIIATDSSALQHMDGDVVKDIVKQKEYKAILPAPALTVTHRWDRRWWVEGALGDQTALLHPDALNEAQLRPTIRIHRANTNIKSPGGYCLNSIELPTTDYHDSLLVTRSVYVDDPKCVEDWAKLYNKKGIVGVNKEVQATLKVLFPKVFGPTAPQPVPQIQATEVYHVPHAWSIIKSGTGVDDDELLAWSINPLGTEPVYLVGDSYKVSFGWQASAYMSSARMLNAKFGASIGSTASPDTWPAFSLEFPQIQCDPNTRVVKYPVYDF